jgi:nitric oxide reductase subunit C
MRFFRQTSVLLIVLLMVVLSACGGSAATPTPAFPPDSPEGRGVSLFSGKGRCATCHSLSAGTTIVGPSLAGIAGRASERIPGMKAADYLEDSILRPDKYKVPGFELAVMDASLAKTLTTDEISDLVAYMLTLK